jgi:hypothetical protein
MIIFCSPGGDDRNPGTYELPMHSPALAVCKLHAGDTLYLRGGVYTMENVVAPESAGTEMQPIVISGWPGDDMPVLNAEHINFFTEKDKYPWGVSTGIIFIYNVSHIHVRHIKVMNSTGQGIAVRDADHIVIDGCVSENSFACGISLWDTKSTGKRCAHNRVVSNTVINATTWDWMPEGMKRKNEPPHESISVAGACYFEVSHNELRDCFKEGIDVKENSHHGTVHHNHVYRMGRQGLYVDAWFGAITHVDFYANHVHDCGGSGIAVSVEEGHYVSDVRFSENIITDISGSGVLFSTWGADGKRSHIEICNNYIKRCGGGKPSGGSGYFWITGGLCLLSANLSDSHIHHNVFAENTGFDIGAGDRWLPDRKTSGDAMADISAIQDSLNEKNVSFYEKLFPDADRFNGISYPIKTSYEDNDILYRVQ